MVLLRCVVYNCSKMHQKTEELRNHETADRKEEKSISEIFFDFLIRTP